MSPSKRNLFVAVLLSCVVAAVDANQSSVYLHDTFEDVAIGDTPDRPALRRVDQVSVMDGGGRVGEGQVAHYHDNTTSGGAMEYNVGTNGLSSLVVEFDLLNNRSGNESGSSPIIFSVGQWNPSDGLSLNANAKRAFGLEFYQAGTSKTIALRVGKSAVQRGSYALDTPQHVKIWVNDRDQETQTYVRPDTGEQAMLNPDSFVVWINDALIGDEPAFGYAMQTSVTVGDGVLGRVGFNSTSKGTADFLIDNVHVEDPAGASAPVAPGQVLPSATGEVTPVRMAGAETFAYRAGGTNAMSLFVYKPQGWRATDRRPAFIHFFGGGWTRGTPLKSASWASWSADQGFVGIAPDYRTKNRFGTSPLSSVADGRAAFNWVVQHASDLGIDRNRIVVGGTSAGGHVALWTAIATAPPGSDPEESPRIKPAAVILSSAVTDTSEATGYTSSRFGEHANALSPVHQLDSDMPPVLMFHSEVDELVDYSTAVALRDALTDAGNVCELVTVPQGGHGFTSALPEWKTRVRDTVRQFLRDQKLLPDSPISH